MAKIAGRRKRRRKKRVFYSLQVLRAAAVRAQGNLCYWCGKEMLPALPENETDPRMVSADHLIPLHNGGMTRPGNIVAACRLCNSSRHPELNKVKGGQPTITIGEDKPTSPFEILTTKFRVAR